MIDLSGPFGLGTFWLGQPEVDEDDATAVVERALAAGVRYLDTAPLYGAGRAERRVGAALQGRGRNDYLLSTKAGRRVVDEAAGVVEYDFSADGITRSVHDSLTRLGLDRVDVCLIHDPDDHADQALGEAYPALEKLRSEGLFDAIGVGIMSTALPVRFIRETDIDVVLIAGRYSLLDRSAADALLPAAAERGVSVVVGGVFNSGILADPDDDDRLFDMTAPSRDRREQARRIAAICARHGVPVRAAAMQFALRDPTVSTALVGCASVAELDDNLANVTAAIPDELWDELARA